MAVARGSVQHSLSDDFRSALKVFLKPKRYCGAADQPEKEALAAELREYFDTDFATLFPYARTGFYATLKALNLPAGSEILLTPVTIGPMYEVCRNLNLQPVFVDIELQTFGPDLALLESKLEKKPAAFLLTYLFGMVPDLRRITELCEKHDVPLIEDFSHNIGARFEGRLLGTFGVAGIYSASLLKYVDSYNGSFVITPSKRMYEALSHLSQGFSATDVKRVRKIIFRSVLWNFALSRWTFTFFTFPTLRLLKFLSRNTFENLLGPAIKLNVAYDTLPAYYFEDIASIQCQTMSRYLKTLDSLLRLRRRCAEQALSSMPDREKGDQTTLIDSNREHVFWQFVVPVWDLGLAREELFKSGVETNSTNLMDLADASGVSLPNAQALKKAHIFVPLHGHLRAEDYRKIFEVLKRAEAR